ncbi:MAG TPA: hypothetical protein VD838_03360, partial [Anaeromyxobacteraceae bacterium]|nr:hypothetical protein [Anaeromyxobacteraceae bacterium]
MTDAGALTIAVRWREGRVGSVVPALERPRAADLLVARTPAEALELVPRLHAICGHAQTAAARGALAAAGAGLPPVEGSGARVLLEEAQEHLWRLLRDWPEALGVPAGAAGEAFGV